MVGELLSSRREWWADQVMAVGLALSSIGICTSVPLVYVGYVVTGIGALLIPQQIAPFLVGSGWAIALSAWIVLCGWLSPYSNEAIPPAWTFCWPALSVWAFAASHPRRIKNAWIGVAISGALAGGLALIQFTVGYRQDLAPLRMGGDGERGVQASGFYSHWIRYGIGQAFITMWVVAWLHALPRPAIWRLAGIFLVGLLGIMFVVISGARGAILALFVGAWVLTIGVLPWRRALVSSMILLGLLGAAVFLIWPVHGARLMDVLAGRDGRTFIWHTAWETFSLHPWLGVGGFAYDESASVTVAQGLSQPGPEGERMGNAHNSFLSLLVLYGIPGLILWMGWVARVVLHIWRLRHRHPGAWPLVLATLGVFIVGSLTEDLAAYAASRFQLFFGLALALGCTAYPQSDAVDLEIKNVHLTNSGSADFL